MNIASAGPSGWVVPKTRSRLVARAAKPKNIIENLEVDMDANVDEDTGEV